MKNFAPLVLLACILASKTSEGSELFRTPFTQLPDRTETGPYVEVASQFTRSSSLQQDGRQTSNQFGQRLNSSVTEVTLGYNFTRSFGVELDAPFIYREYQRVRRFDVENDQTAGVGDISLIANWTAIRVGEGERFFGLKLSGGVELPTGDGDRLKEEAEEPEALTALVLTQMPAVTAVPQFVPALLMRPNGSVIPVYRFVGNTISVTPAKFEEKVVGRRPRDPLRGKDLALGSGSVDGILAANLYTRWNRLFLTADARYTIRSEGTFDYRYGNCFQWSGGPGLYALEEPDLRVAIQAICSGEVNDNDQFQGRRRDGTALTAVYVGPAISAYWKEQFSVSIGAELPVLVDNAGLQLVPDFRLQISVALQF